MNKTIMTNVCVDKLTDLAKQQLIDKAIDDLGGDISKARLYGHKGNIYLRYSHGYILCHPNSLSYAEGDYFCTIEEFEQRKKEREMEKNSWYDYENQKNVAVPPVDTECEYSLNDGRNWYKCKVVSQHKLVLHCPHIEGYGGYINGLQILTEDEVILRPLDWDKLSKRKQAIAYAMELSPDWAKLEDIFGSLYDAGMLKLPEDK